MELDNKDKAILEQLEKDARMQIKNISKKTGIPADTINYRIKKMLNNGIIKGFSPVCDTTKLGKPIYSWVNLTLQKYDSKFDDAFISYLRSLPEIVYVAKVTGAYHYLFTVATASIKEFDIVFKKILEKFSDAIKSYNTSLMIEEIQYDTFHRLIN
jgi:Lrp/AsnC family transcriptional regulator, leucine-responsive regulatory protein